jgi:hypothetical protein
MDILTIPVLAVLVVVILFLPKRRSERVAKTAVIVIAALVVALLIRLSVDGVQLVMDLRAGRALRLFAKAPPVVESDHSAIGFFLIAAIALAMGVETWRWWRSHKRLKPKPRPIGSPFSSTSRLQFP